MSKMIKCKTCGADIAANAKTCPSCGAKNKKPFYTKWWFWVIVALIVFGAIGSQGNSNSQNVVGNMQTGETSSTNTGTNTVQEEKKDNLELVGEVSDESDEFATYLTGVVKNNTQKDYSYVQITFNLYDADGNIVGTAIDNINNLEAGGTWKFKAMGIGESGTPASYKLSEITGY